MNDKALDALQNWNGAIHFGDRTNEADELRRYRATGLTPEEIIRLNTFSGSQIEKLLAENATLKKALELACDECSFREHPYDEYVQKARADNACQNNL